jgi:prepilin peptidase CpaA
MKSGVLFYRKDRFTVVNILLFIVLIISFITDIRSRKILNIVTLPGIIMGVAYHTFTSGWSGLLYSGSGFLVGFSLLLIPYLLGGMGAGDVKLLAAIGSLKGAAFVFTCFLYTCAIGGIIALLILIVKKEFFVVFRRLVFAAKFRSLDGLDKNELHHAFPYGIAIVLGAIITNVLGLAA